MNLIGCHLEEGRAVLNVCKPYFLLLRLLVMTSVLSLYAPTAMAARQLAAAPIFLSENTLDQAVISVSVVNDSFSDQVASFVQLNLPPPGTSLKTVLRFNPQVLHITLNYDGTDFDQDHHSFSVTILDGGFSGSGSETSNPMTVKALKEVEDLNRFTVSGDSYPLSISMTGYNAREKELHLKAVLHTEADVGAQTVTFEYFVVILDQLGQPIGNLGTYENPLKIRAPAGVPSVELKNLVLSVPQGLPKTYKIIILVKNAALESS